MKSSYALCAALLLCGTAFAAPAMPAASNTIANSAIQTGKFPPLAPTCMTGFTYSVKEQFGNPATGHLWFICRADVTCPGVMTAVKNGSYTSFRFAYTCALQPPAAMLGCAPGFAKGSISAAANIPGCMTPMITCPSKFSMMTSSATVAADKKSAKFEYQCYRPGT